MGQALNKTGRRINYMCNFPWQLWKMKGDVANGGAWTPEVCNSWRTCGDPGPGFTSAVGYVDCWERWADAIPSGPGGYATLDAMEVGNGGMSVAEQQAIFSLYALVKTPLYIGADVTTLVGDTLAVYTNKAVIAWNQDSLGVPGRNLRQASDAKGELWAGPLEGGATAAVLLNRGSKAMNITASWSEFHWWTPPYYGNMNVSDAWTGKITRVNCADRGCAGAGITELVPPHSAVAITIRPIPKSA
jgi:alpha-galactosidase